MKKNYNNPKMNISLFEKEDIVTGSGDIPNTAENLAMEALNAANVTRTIKVTF